MGADTSSIAASTKCRRTPLVDLFNNMPHHSSTRYPIGHTMRYYKTIRALPSSAAHHPPQTTIHRLTRSLDTPPHELPSSGWEGALPPSTTACTGLPTPTPALV